MKQKQHKPRAGGACLTRACYAYYKRPVKTPDGYWKYRRGGYDPKDGTYGRCWARSEAMDIIRHNAPVSAAVTKPEQNTKNP